MLMCQCLSPSSKLTYRSPGLAVSWSRRTVRVVAISMLLAKEWKAVLTRRRRTCQSYIASLGRPATNWESSHSTHQRHSQTSNHGRKADSCLEFSVCLHGVAGSALTARMADD